MEANHQKLNEDGMEVCIPRGGFAILNRQNKMLAYRKEAIFHEWAWVRVDYRK